MQWSEKFQLHCPSFKGIHIGLPYEKNKMDRLSQKPISMFQEKENKESSVMIISFYFNLLGVRSDLS